MMRLGMLMMKRSFRRLLRLVRMVVRFYLKPKKEEISFWIEFIRGRGGVERGCGGVVAVTDELMDN